VDSLRVVVQQSAVAADLTLLSDGDLQDAYRRITRLSAPILRLLRGVQVVLNRRAPSAESVANRMPLSPSTIHVLLPVIMEVLVLQAVIPGSEMAFYLLDTYDKSCSVMFAPPHCFFLVCGHRQTTSSLSRIT
jgi:hypothetical protein